MAEFVEKRLGQIVDLTIGNLGLRYDRRHTLRLRVTRKDVMESPGQPEKFGQIVII